VETADAAHEAAHSAALRRLAAVGLAGYGVVHLLVAWLALQLAWRSGDRTADPNGALALLAGSPGGGAVLWTLAIGFAALALWQAVEVLRHRRSVPPPGPDRRRVLGHLVRTVATASLYGYLGVTAARAALIGGRPRAEEQSTARGVLDLPGGQLLVLAVAAVVAGVGAHLVRKGWRAAFTDELDLEPFRPRLRRVTKVLCQLAFVTKGVALVLVGGVAAWAAVTVDPAQATGLDGALRAIAATRAGPWALTVIAVGTAVFSVYCFARARHPVG
jgi:hypothetical protein